MRVNVVSMNYALAVVRRESRGRERGSVVGTFGTTWDSLGQLGTYWDDLG